MAKYTNKGPGDLPEPTDDPSSPAYDSTADEAADEALTEAREQLVTLPTFIADLTLNGQEANKLAAAINGVDHAEVGRLLVDALYRQVDECLESTIKLQKLTSSDAAVWLVEVCSE